MDSRQLIHLRRAEPADAMAVARVHVRSWQAAYRGLLPDEYLDGLRPEDRATSYTFGGLEPDHPATIVSVEGEMIRGFATIGPSRDAGTEGIGALHALYVDPDSWDTGLGRTLIGEARQQLAGQGFEQAVLWVLVGNERAERFYRKDGWAADGSRRSDEVWSVAIDEVRYRRTLS
jgi:GNAT superfamily N-acetyltransferase